MNYGVYKDARNAAWLCLLDHGISALPVSLKTITENCGIRVIPNSSVAMLSPGERGKAVAIDHAWYIIVNDEDTPRACRFTIAHELGHIFMGHAVKKGYVGHARSHHFVSKPETESAADTFAARLLCPAVALYALDVHTPQEIMEICDVSYTCATLRAKRMEVLYQRNRFFQSTLERRVYENFRPFIESRK